MRMAQLPYLTKESNWTNQNPVVSLRGARTTASPTILEMHIFLNLNSFVHSLRSYIIVITISRLGDHFVDRTTRLH
jgi:hypothetical protein